MIPAQPRCPCGGSTFPVIRPYSQPYSVTFAVCRRCGSTVGHPEGAEEPDGGNPLTAS
jgi:hypothetical protein